MSIISNYRNQNKEGLTLIEVLIGITIFGVLVAAVFGIYQTITATNDANEAGRNIQTVYNNTAKMFRRSPTSGLNNQAARDAGLFPQSMNLDPTDGTTVYNIFEGSVVISEVPTNGFELLYPNVPTGETCLSIIQSQMNVGWDTVDTDAETDVDILGEDTATPIELAAACSADAIGDVTDLTFTKNG